MSSGSIATLINRFIADVLHVMAIIGGEEAIAAQQCALSKCEMGKSQLLVALSRLEGRFNEGRLSEKTSVVAEWLHPLVQLDMLPDVTQTMFLLLRLIETAQRPDVSSATRSLALSALYVCGQPVFSLLTKTIAMAKYVKDSGVSPFGDAIMAYLVGFQPLPDILSKLLRSLSSLREHVESADGQSALSNSDFDAAAARDQVSVVTGACTALAAAVVRLCIEIMMRDAQDLGLQRHDRSRIARITTRELIQNVNALTPLLPAVATAILETQPPRPGSAFDTFVADTLDAARDAAEAIYQSVFLKTVFGTVAAPAGAREAVHRQVDNAHVRRLQGALLDRVLLHAGMMGEGAGAGGDGGASSSDVGGGGGSGWWLVREEAQQQRIFGLPAGSDGGGGGETSRTTVWLESQHCVALFASVHMWHRLWCIGEYDTGGSGTGGADAAPAGGPATSSGRRSGARGRRSREQTARWSAVGAGARAGAAPAGSPGTDGESLAPPSPDRVSAAGARAAEAMCRLCRGQGLNGAYTHDPGRTFVRTEMYRDILAVSRPYNSLSQAEGTTLMANWLEAAAWGLAMAVDAEEALRATPRPASVGGQDAAANALWGTVPQGCMGSLVQADGQSTAISQTLATLAQMHIGAAQTFLPPAGPARDVLVARLHRAGLSASLDHALRLFFSAQDRGLPAARTLSDTQTWVATILCSEVVAQMCPATGPAGGADQLGLLVTAAKRARLVAPLLDVKDPAAVPSSSSSSSAGAASQGQLQQLQQWHDLFIFAGSLTWILLIGSRWLREEVLGRREGAGEQARARDAGGGRGSGGRGHGGGGSGGGEEPHGRWDTDARCRTEAEEVIALAARAASTLIMSLAHAAATEVSERGAEYDKEAVEWVLVQAHGYLVELPHWVFGLTLPHAQLLACQLHRVFASMCTLLAAVGPNRTQQAKDVALQLIPPLTLLAARPNISTHVHRWLSRPESSSSPPPKHAGKAAPPAGGAAETGSTHGCLRAPLQSLVSGLAALDGGKCARRLLALLKLVDTRAEPGADRAGGGRGASGSFLAGATAMALQEYSPEALCLVLADGWLPTEINRVEQLMRSVEVPAATRQSTRGPRPPVPQLPTPLPLAMWDAPPAASMLSRLRVCANPSCGTFSGRSEESLPFKQCGGCRAVRYCCQGCQKAHWLGGHRGECALLAGGGTQAGAGAGSAGAGS